MPEYLFYKSGDEEKIAEIENVCFSAPWSIESIKESYSSIGAFAVIAYENKAIAYIGAKKSFDEAEIYNIGVLPEFRGRKIGESLVRICINELKKQKVNKCFLEVRSSNIPAISLYEKFGFKKISIRKNYYKLPTEDAMIMQLNITE